MSKIPDYQMPLVDDKLNEELTILDDNGHDVNSHDGDGDDYVGNVSGTEENGDSELR